jgi:hypothetical protein
MEARLKTMRPVGRRRSRDRHEAIGCVIAQPALDIVDEDVGCRQPRDDAALAGLADEP